MASVSAVGYAVVARDMKDGTVRVITDGIEDWLNAEKVRSYHTDMQQTASGYYEGSYISYLSPSDYAAWLKGQGQTPVCRGCGRPIEVD